MTDHDHILRGLLTACALATLLMSGSFFGTIWPERGWPVRVVCGGLFGVLVYAFAGQIKAYNLGIPFDGFSWIGLIAYAVLAGGLAWFVYDRRTNRGR
jgi:hypothetical protein